MSVDASQLITQHLVALQNGDEGALDRVLPLLYEDLRRIAARIQQPGQSLNPTALVHEAYARLANADSKSFNDRRHFMRVAARAMRQLLTDHARHQRREKRGGNAQRVTLRAQQASDEGIDFDLIALDEALTKLGTLSPRQARVVELRFLTGLTVEETAEVLEISKRTVKADWHLARAWLSREMLDGEQARDDEDD